MLELHFDTDKAHKLSEVLAHLFDGPIFHALENVTTEAEAAARRAAKPHPVDTGHTARSIDSSVTKHPGSPVTARVFTRQQGAEAIDQGRRPGGKFPPREPIRQWAVRHGLGANMTFVVQRAIARHGTRGLFFMDAAKAAALKSLPRHLDNAFRQIQAEWGRVR